MQKQQLALRQIALQLFASSFKEICPKVMFIDMNVGRLGFSLDFILPFSLTKDYQDLIEQRVRAKCKKPVEITVWEMGSKNAVEYLKHLGQPFLADQIDLGDPLALIFREGDFGAPLKGEVEKDLAKVGAFYSELIQTNQTVKWQKGEISIQRIIGDVFISKEEMKQARRVIKEAEKTDHRKIGEESGWFQLFEDGSAVWFPKGMERYDQVKASWEEVLKASGAQKVSTSEDSQRELLFKEGINHFYEIVKEDFEDPEDFGLKTSSEEEVGIWGTMQKEKTTLQTIEDFCKIVSLTISRRELDRSVCYVAEDAYQTEWPLIAVEEFLGAVVVKFFFNRIFALIVEQNSGWPVKKVY